MTNTVENITAVILAGGAGRRMNARNKGLLTLDNKPLVAHIIDIIKQQVSDIIISANADIAEYQQFGYPVVTDRFSEELGPLAGIASCLDQVSTDYAVILPCDSPFIPTTLVARMVEHYQQSDADVCVVNDGKRTQPLFMFLNIALKDSLEKTLDQGNRKVFAWLDNVKTVEVDFSDCPNAFMNINTPQDLEQANKKQ